MNSSTLRLFNAIQVESKTQGHGYRSHPWVRCISNGYILHHDIDPQEDVLNAIEKVVGISGVKANSSFHKSWAIVKDSDIEDLVIQQIVHYITTYGFEALGIYREDTVYIPKEELDIPQITEDIRLVFIKAMTKDEILSAIMELGEKVALAQRTLDDIMIIINHNNYNSKFVEHIGNRELKALLYKFYNIVPSDPMEFLRYIIVNLTGQSLVIKNDYLINLIKESNHKLLDTYLKKAPKDLAKIFFRFKPLFLAMKSISSNKNFFNRLRKDANKMHVAMPTDYFNSITGQIKNGELNLNVLKNKLKKPNIFRKIRLAYALSNRLNAVDSIVYHIRNGRGWVTDFKWSKKLNKRTQKALDAVLKSTAKEIEKNVSDKTFFIPKNIHYALPATEKQFVGAFPSNSYITLPDDIIFGVHWFDVGDRWIDLDFSMISNGTKIGWNTFYRTDDSKVLFSGDLTSAPKPNGSSELFYIKKGGDTPYGLFLNYFNFDSSVKVPYKFFIANEEVDNLSKNYMVNPNNIIISCNMEMTEKQNNLGLLVFVKGENRFYFSNAAIGNSIASKDDDVTRKAREYTIATSQSPIKLETVLQMAGANVVNEKPEDNEYVDLSPEVLDKTTIIKLFQ